MTSTVEFSPQVLDCGDPDMFKSDEVNTHERVLLEALQAFIIPLVRAANDTIQIKASNQSQQFGHEAASLITALKAFVSTIIHIQEPEQDAIGKIDLDDVPSPMHTGAGTATATETETAVMAFPPKKLLKFMRLNDDRKLFLQTILPNLHAHVFNKMPIRLLYFVQRKTHFQVSLIERAAVYNHICSIMEAHMDDKHSSILRPEEEWETFLEASTHLIHKYARYAILSHTWLRSLPGEVTYNDWKRGILDDKAAGYKKLVGFCKTAWREHGLCFGWIDTVCINKDSSSELDESIRSMYDWYDRASICITYLADTRVISEMYRDPWFTRGWTLQELLAPKSVKFYNQNWECFIKCSNDKSSEDIITQISKATLITKSDLYHIRSTPLSHRMVLAAGRKVTREEDMAYSLMGIFNVSIPIAYGEGAKRAFTRLVHEILCSTSYSVLQLLNFGGISGCGSGLLPQSPENYVHRSRSFAILKSLSYQLTTPLIPTHIGICIPVVLMPGVHDAQNSSDTSPEHMGDYMAITQIELALAHNVNIKTTFCVLDSRFFSDKEKRGTRCKLAVFNIQPSAQSIFIPRFCIAKLVSEYNTDPVQYLTHDTKYPVVFELRNKQNKYEKRGQSYEKSKLEGVTLSKDELATHGMEFTSLYL